jgi:hypothetical protein
MSDTANIRICILWENELKAASKALRAFADKQEDESSNKLLQQAVSACLAALWNIDDDCALAIIGAGSLQEHLAKRSASKLEPKL